MILVRNTAQNTFDEELRKFSRNRNLCAIGCFGILVVTFLSFREKGHADPFI